MNTTCCACARLVSPGCARCACGSTRFRLVKATVRVSARAAGPAGAKCGKCGATLATDVSTCSACGTRPARTLSDAELLGELRAMVSRRPRTTEQERSDEARREARQFAQSRAGLLDIDRPVAPSRRYVMLAGVMGPMLVPVPGAAEARAAVDRVNHEFERVERAMGRA